MTPEELAVTIPLIGTAKMDKPLVINAISQAIREAVLEEREACAKIAEAEATMGKDECCSATCQWIAAAIRARITPPSPSPAPPTT